MDLQVKLGSANLTILSGYDVNSRTGTYDVTPLFGNLTTVDQPGYLWFENYRSNKYNEEMRLAFPVSTTIASAGSKSSAASNRG